MSDRLPRNIGRGCILRSYRDSIFAVRQIGGECKSERCETIHRPYFHIAKIIVGTGIAYYLLLLGSRIVKRLDYDSDIDHDIAIAHIKPATIISAASQSDLRRADLGSGKIPCLIKHGI